MQSPDIAALISDAEKLLRQCKKHQLFREKQEEAGKQGEAGAIYLRLAQLTYDDARDEHLEAASQCFSRAKRLCRDLLRGKSDNAA